jgi:NAD(P)-dependent dehydrogenase (short-subunit alcohol dehydrogenase family)
VTKPVVIGFKLHGRRALVTGSASDIGLATAERLTRSGAHVAMNGLQVQHVMRSWRFSVGGSRFQAAAGIAKFA